MLRVPRPRLTYANVTATLALFIALGGSAYAGLKISGKDIEKHTITGRNIKPNSLGRRAVKESSLSAVPRALDAARLGGFTAERFLVRCPQGTIPAASICIETQTHPAAAYGSAAEECGRIDNRLAAGRRLPTHNELTAALPSDQIQLASGGELTGNVYPSASMPGRVEALFIADEGGSVGITPDTFAGAKAYRCVTVPLN
jgi:hypothetical protein